MARKSTKNGATDTPSGERGAAEVPAVGAITRTSEGSHELVSYGDGTARERPIVNASGQYPPRPERDEE